MENRLYQIRYTPLAYEDLDEIDNYIAQTLENPAAADRLMEKMEKSINRLKKFPYIGAVVGDVYLAARGYRKIVVDNYMVFYLVSDERQTVIVMRIIHSARKYRNML